MTPFLIKPILHLQGKIILPGDKSIAHRAIILSALASGKTTIENIPANKDCFFTLRAFQRLGISVAKKPFPFIKGANLVTISGKGLGGLKEPKGALFVGDSGTTCRLLLGVIAGQSFKVKLTAGKSLSQRPMLRVTEPLRMMGAEINARAKRVPLGSGALSEEYLPILIRGGNLGAISYTLPVASAQVKSALLLAGLYAQGNTVIIEPKATRDHTERMLKLFKAEVKVKGNRIVIKGKKSLASPKKIHIPGDISSASFFMVMAAILPRAEIIIKNVSLNPTRLGIVKVLSRMGARIKIRRSFSHLFAKFEPVGDIIINNSLLKGVRVKAAEIPFLIDELPVLMVAASIARGRTVFEGAQELRVKETDRIVSMSEGLTRLGARVAIRKIRNREDIVVEGVSQLKGCQLRSFGDHRTAMSLIVAGLAASGQTRIDDVSCISKSFPEFIAIIKKLIR